MPNIIKPYDTSITYSIDVKFGDIEPVNIHYSFKTREETDAFLLGLAEMDGWMDYDYEIEELRE